MNTQSVFALAIVLLGIGCGGTSIGQPCTNPTECNLGQVCVTTAPGGSCTKGCAVEGSQRDCPGGSVCAPILDSLLCAPTCEATTDCRSGYECAEVGGTGLKACRPTS